MLSILETVLDDDFEKKYEVLGAFPITWKKHFKLSVALAGLEYCETELAVDMFTNTIDPTKTTMLIPRDRDQSEKVKKYKEYFGLLADKYRECLVASGVPIKPYNFAFYGIVEERFPEYIGKVNEKPFFDYVRELAIENGMMQPTNDASTDISHEAEKE